MGTRITLTKRESESPTGTQLIDLILKTCHDGELEIQEIDELHLFLRRDQSRIAAVAYLRALTREAVADGAIDGPEAYRLKQAFKRVVPKAFRGVVSTHLETIGVPTLDEGSDDVAWTRHEATFKQIEYVIDLGGKIAPGLTKGQASAQIDSLLERRPPTPRQQMLLRFFNRLDLSQLTKAEISAWLDELFCNQPDCEAAWERFKLDTDHDPRCRDPSVVPVGAFQQYSSGAKRVGTSRRSGCALALCGFILAAAYVMVVPLLL